MSGATPASERRTHLAMHHNGRLDAPEGTRDAMAMVRILFGKTRKPASATTCDGCFSESQKS